jgi:hypothetical protein
VCKYLIAALCVLVASAAAAQETTSGSIAGRVVDTQGLGVPGATVEVISGQGTKTLVTDGEGRFVAPFLVPGAHTVRVRLEGFRTVEQTGIEVRLGQRINLAFTLVAALAEAVEVVGQSPVVDVSSTTAGTNMSGPQLSAIPLSRRFTDVLYAAPGVSSSGGVGEANASIAGASGLENLYTVDGVNITNTGFGGVGSYSGTFGSLGTAIPYDFIEQVQVKTAGADAEYGEATGGIVNVITRSGTNNLRGSVFAYSQPDALVAPYRLITTQEGTVNTTGTRATDIGLVIGGPVRRDRLFYFGALNPAWDRTILIAPEGFPLRSLGEVNRDRRTVSYAAKATFQMAANHRIETSFFGDPSTGKSGAQRPTALLRVDTSAFSAIKYGGHQQAARYNWIIRPNWFFEASVARAANSVQETPVLDEWSLTDRRVSPAVRSGGIGSYLQKNPGSNVQYSATSNSLLGPHELRFGFLFSDVDFAEYSFQTGPRFTLPDGRESQSGANLDIRPDPVYGQIYRVTYAQIAGAVRQTSQRYFDFFVQDTWKVGDRLTVRPGVRYERQTLSGQASYTFKGNWAPRIGVTFDPTGSRQSKVYAHWGRFFNKLPNNTAARSLTAIPDVRLADYFDSALTQPVPNGVLALGTTVHFRTASGGVSEVEPGAKSGYQDEFVVGLERDLGNGLNVGVRYTRRDTRRVFEDIANAAMVLYFLPEANLDSVTYFLGNPGDGTPPTLDGIGAFEAPVRTYDAVEVTAGKRFAEGWSLIASYRWSRLQGTYEGYYLNDTGESNPGLLSLYDFPTNDPSYTEIGGPEFGFRGDIRYLGKAGAGPLPLDSPHQVKVYGNYAFDMGLNLGLGLSFGSGGPLTAMAAGPVYGRIPETPRGEGMETADGFAKRNPMTVNADFNASYWKHLGSRRVGLLVDLFNLFDRRRVLDYNQNTEITFGVPNPDFGKVSAYQRPRRIRLGVRFEF